MASSTTKKVVVRRFDREPLIGFVSTVTFQLPSGIELLKPDGTVAEIPYAEIKSVTFVKDFESVHEPVGTRTFQNRPKTEGLWVRLKFRDGEVLDGILPNDLLRADPQGYTVTPPDAYSNNQKVFVPRDALQSIQVVSVVGNPIRKTPKRTTPDESAQAGLFE